MITIAQGSDEQSRPSGGFHRRNRFRYLTTAELLNERELYQWSLLELIADVMRDEENWCFANECLAPRDHGEARSQPDQSHHEHVRTPVPGVGTRSCRPAGSTPDIVLLKFWGTVWGIWANERAG